MPAHSMMLCGCGALDDHRTPNSHDRTRPDHSFLPLQSAATLHQAETQLASARKDLTPLLSTAQAKLDSFGEQTRAELARLSAEANNSAASNSGQGIIIGADGMPILMDDVPELPPATKVDTKGKGKGVDRGVQGETAAPPVSVDSEAGAQGASEPTPAAQAAAFFTKFQSQIAANPNIHDLTKNLATLQESVQSGLAHQTTAFQSNIAQLQDQLAHLDLVEQQKKASGLISKGEGWIAELSSEVSRMAKDAVKIVPGTEPDQVAARKRDRDGRLAKAEQVAVGRRDQLLFKLRTEKTLVLADPGQGGEDEATKWTAFLARVEDKGGLEGEEWANEIGRELEQAGEGLARTVAELVPAQLTKEAFWSRYFFRAAQIDEDEQKRKQLLEGTASSTVDDDFDWDADDDTSVGAASPIVPPPAAASDHATAAVTNTAAPPNTAAAESFPASAETSEKSSPVMVEGKGASPRVSSDGASSYDVVGRASGAPSESGEPALGAVVGVKAEPVQTKEEKEESEESDWE